MERDLAASSTTYAPYDPMTGGVAPAGAAGVPADAQTTALASEGGISTTALLAVGAGAVLLFALSRKGKDGKSVAGSMFAGWGG